MASLSERVATDAEKTGDRAKLQTLWKYAPSAYSGEHIVELPYVFMTTTQVAPNPVTVTALNQFKINSIFDPDLTGAGVQPLGRDTWASIYDYYKVLETNISYEIISLDYRTPAAGSFDPVKPSIVGWMADITANPPASVTTWLFAAEAGDMNKQQKFCRPDMVDVIAGRAAGKHSNGYHWNAEDFDTSIIDTAGKNTWTPVGSDPANLNYFSVLANNPEAVAGGGQRNFHYKVIIKYLVAFKTVNRSLLNTLN